MGFWSNILSFHFIVMPSILFLCTHVLKTIQVKTEAWWTGFLRFKRIGKSGVVHIMGEQSRINKLPIKLSFIYFLLQDFVVDTYFLCSIRLGVLTYHFLFFDAEQFFFKPYMVFVRDSLSRSLDQGLFGTLLCLLSESFFMDGPSSNYLHLNYDGCRWWRRTSLPFWSSWHYFHCFGDII